MKHISTIEALELIENLCNLLSKKELEVAALSSRCDDLAAQTRQDEISLNERINSGWLGGRPV